MSVDQSSLHNKLLLSCAIASPALETWKDLKIKSRTAKILLKQWHDEEALNDFIDGLSEQEALGIIYSLLRQKIRLVLTPDERITHLVAVTHIIKSIDSDLTHQWAQDPSQVDTWLTDTIKRLGQSEEVDQETVELALDGEDEFDFEPPKRKKSSTLPPSDLALPSASTPIKRSAPIEPPMFLSGGEGQRSNEYGGEPTTGAPSPFSYEELSEISYPEGLPPEDFEDDDLAELVTDEESSIVDKDLSQLGGLGQGLIDHELIQPGPLERALERIRMLTWCLYLFFGYGVLYVINLIDNLWSLVSEYITKIFKGLMGLKSSLKVSTWRSSGQLDMHLSESVHQTLLLTERHLCLPSYSDLLTLDHNKFITPMEIKNPLAVALSVRAQLDDLRRDLGFIRPQSGKRTFWLALKGVMIDLIPNPISFFRPWVNIILIGWRLKYSRQQVIDVHDLLVGECKELIELVKSQQTNGQISQVHQDRINQLIDQIEGHINTLLIVTLQSRYHAQPKRWSTHDHMMAMIAVDYERTHPLCLLYSRVLILERIVKQQTYQSTPEYDELIRSQQLVKVCANFRKQGLI